MQAPAASGAAASAPRELGGGRESTGPGPPQRLASSAGNMDRHHYEMFTRFGDDGFLIHLDNARG